MDRIETRPIVLFGLGQSESKSLKTAVIYIWVYLIDLLKKDIGKMDYNKTNIYIPTYLSKQLDAAADILACSPSEFIQQLIRRMSRI